MVGKIGYTKMLWIIQDNLYNEAGYVKFIEALEHFGSDFLVVKPIPFTNIIMPASFNSFSQNKDVISVRSRYQAPNKER